MIVSDLRRTGEYLFLADYCPIRLAGVDYGPTWPAVGDPEQRTLVGHPGASVQVHGISVGADVVNVELACRRLGPKKKTGIG